MLKKLGFKKIARKQKPHMSDPTKDVISGLAGGAVGTIAVFPLDTLTTRAQARYLQSGKQYKGVSAFKRIWKGLPLKESMKGGGKVKQVASLYKGLPFKLLKAAPGTAVTLGTYGVTKRFLDKHFTSKTN
ncbi:MAG: MC/SLC25 family protein [Rhodobacteraceae bacterium]|nr:MC/SLC25 family protein [Paracoccaceae bacterium]